MNIIQQSHVFCKTQNTFFLFLQKGVSYMETEFQSAPGKSIGEVLRDVGEFLRTPYRIHAEKQLDLCTLLPELNMRGQLSFALLSEAQAQGWEWARTESFFRHAVAGVLTDTEVEAFLDAFRTPTGAAFASLEARYGNRFTLFDGSYWATVLALGVDANEVDRVMQYLRRFTVILTEFAFMEQSNPAATYTWNYYESFRRMLEDLTAAPEAAPLPLKVRALGGTAGPREGEGYPLSLGIDLENPNLDRMARNVSLDITLKDQSGAVITVIKDRIRSIDPGAVFHYAITRTVKGAAVATISAVAQAESHLHLDTPIMKHIRLLGVQIEREENRTRFSATLTSRYDTPLQSMILHYHFLDEKNRILGGGSKWILDCVRTKEPYEVQSEIPVAMQNAAKVVYSADFDAMELIRDTE